MAKVLGTVEQLSSRGAELADATVPRFFNGTELQALSGEASSMVADARRARALLGDSPVELLLKDRLAAVAHAGISASNEAGTIKPTIGVIQTFGRTVRDSMRTTMGDVRADIANSTSQALTDVRMVQPRSLGSAAIDDLRHAIELRAALQLPELKLGVRPLSGSDVPAGDPGAHVRLLQRQYMIDRDLMRDVDAASTRIDELIGSDPSKVSALDAAELRALLDVGPDASWTLPRTVGDMPLRDALDALSRGGDEALLGEFAAAVDAHRAVIQTAVPATHAARVDTSLRSLLDRTPTAWSTDDWRSLGALVERDAATGSSLGLPRSIDGARGVERIIRDGIRGRDGAATAMQRYVDAWDTIVPRIDVDATAAAMPDDPRALRLVGELATIVARDPDELKAGDWLRFRTLLDADPAEITLRGPRSLRNASSLYRVLRTDTGYRGIIERQRYVEAWRTVIGPGALTDDARRVETHTLLLRDPESLTAHDWRRLSSLVDGAQPSLVGDLKLGPDVSDLGGIAWRHATDGRAVDGHTRLAFASASLAVDGLTDDTVRLHGAMRELVDRSTGELTPNDWARVRALLEADTTRTVLDGPRYLMSAPSAEVVATSMMSGRDDMQLPARRLIAAWSAHMSGRWSSQEALVDAARRLAVREPSTLAPAEWRELGTMIDIAGPTLRSPRHMGGGVDPLEVTAARAAEGLPIAMPQAERAFRAWRLQFDPELSKPGALMGAVRSLVDRDPATLSPGEWRRLQAIVDFDAGWNTLGFLSMPKGVRTLGELVEDGVEQRPIRLGDWNRVIDAWRLHADGIAVDLPRMESALYDAMSPAAGTFDDAALGQLRAILDADARGGLLKGGRVGDLIDQLHTTVGSARPERLSTDSSLIDRIRNRLLDGSEITERRAQIRAAIDRGRFPERVSLEEIREADPRWADRSPFERLALEGQLGAFSGAEAFTSARDFLHRARDVQPPASLPDPMRALWADSRRLVDVNLERLAGRTPRGEVKGYSTHPDYAQVGRVPSNLELVQRVLGGTHPATQPDQQVRRLGQATAAETLTW